MMTSKAGNKTVSSSKRLLSAFYLVGVMSTYVWIYVNSATSVLGSPTPTASAWTSASSSSSSAASVHRHQHRQLRNKKQASRWLFEMLRPDGGGGGGGGGDRNDDIGGGQSGGGGADASAFDTLYESPESKYDPSPRDLAPAWRLMAQLGPDYDPEFMSVRKPRDAFRFPNGTTEAGFFKVSNSGGGGGGGGGMRHRFPVPSDGVMPGYIRRMNLKYLTLPDGRKVRTRMGRKLRRKMKRFLWSFTACPVVYQWKDLGPRFWPRWIKRGRCQSKVSCSIPAGMTCRPKTTAAKTLLRWHCADYDRREDCRWLPIQHRVVTECQCGCGGSSTSQPSPSASPDADDVNDVFNEIV